VAVEPGSGTVHGGVHFFAVGVVDDADDRGFFVIDRLRVGVIAGMGDQRDGYRVVRDAVQEVGGAVQRVDVPGGWTLRLTAGFLGNDAELRCARAQNVEDGGLRLAVGLRYQIVARLAVYDQVAAVLCVGLQNGGTGMGSGDGCVKRVRQIQGGE